MASKGRVIKVPTVKLRGSSRRKPQVNLAPTYGIKNTSKGALPGKGSGAVTQGSPSSCSKQKALGYVRGS